MNHTVKGQLLYKWRQQIIHVVAERKGNRWKSKYGSRASFKRKKYYL